MAKSNTEIAGKKKPAFSRLFAGIRRDSEGGCVALLLFDLRFFVNHVLADSWIVLLRFHLFRMKLLVLLCGVEVTGSGT